MANGTHRRVTIERLTYNEGYNIKFPEQYHESVIWHLFYVVADTSSAVVSIKAPIKLRSYFAAMYRSAQSGNSVRMVKSHKLIFSKNHLVYFYQDFAETLIIESMTGYSLAMRNYRYLLK